ncbi:MAG: hypothetical protein DMG70_23430 [Acidobacteria bacterium]|nr:MAG: hypothetical protein DMG70_23430 [Acidobacteriota bacterium]PYY08261.1 MAG: hypothetical protein DMG69_15700 [Acidobacteriota bacterium]
MKRTLLCVLLISLLDLSALAQQKVFDWVSANNETVQLDPADYHSGRVYRPGPDGGNIHVGIQAKQPVTIAVMWVDEWRAAQQHPETLGSLNYRCVREHVLSTTYECHLPPERPMVLILHDERNADRAVFTGIGAVLGRDSMKNFLSPNDVAVQYYSWSCVDHCIQPQYQWIRLVKEKYEISSVPKIYNLLTPERDGQPLNLRIKAPTPMTIAVVPQALGDQVYDNPETLSSALSKTSCKQRGVQSLSFDCNFNLADGPQSIVVVPASATPPRKKAEIELQTLKCTANCNVKTD